MEELYGCGTVCTWHGPLTFAAPVQVNAGDEDHAETQVCPHCGLLLRVTTSATFWDEVRAQQRKLPGYMDMMRWSEGKCFPDFDTLQNAYRQHMEGR